MSARETQVLRDSLSALLDAIEHAEDLADLEEPCRRAEAALARSEEP